MTSMVSVGDGYKNWVITGSDFQQTHRIFLCFMVRNTTLYEVQYCKANALVFSVLFLYLPAYSTILATTISVSM